MVHNVGTSRPPWYNEAMPPDERTSTASCPARCALAGNPSDGHGGAVVATTIEPIRATVQVRDSDTFRIAGRDLALDSIAAVVEHVRADGPGDEHPLVAATLVALHEILGATLRPVTIEVHTTIPRSLGLAGSSAIVIATIRALIAHQPDETWARRLDTDRSLLASLALAAERDVLGIAAGLQDRVVQSFGGTVAMDFGPGHRRTIDGLEAGTYRSLSPPPGVLLVAYRPETATASGAVHGSVDASDHEFASAMQTLGRQAHRAAHAIEVGDAEALGRAMSATFDVRASVMDLDPRHVEMIEVARRHGAAANYTGSGGAVVVLTASAGAMTPVREALHGELGCRTLPVS